MPTNPPNKATVDFPFQSVVVDTVVIERSSSFSGTYTPVEPGTPFILPTHTVADQALYSAMVLLGQKAGKDREFQERTWGLAPTTQDLYNYDISYSDENRSYPIFKRRYLELRDQYQVLKRAENSLFTGIYAVQVNAGGTGYTNGDTVTLTGGGGTGASAIVITNPTTGAIVKITLKSEGSGYTTAPTVVLPSGSGASATAIIQPAGTPSCQLISENVTQAPEPWGSLYNIVERIYEALDGPVRTDWVQNPEDQIAASIAKQRIATSEVTEPTPSLGVNKEIKHLSNAVSEISNETLDPTQMSNYYRAFVKTGSVNLPPVLLALNYLWTISQGYGNGSSSGTGFAVGTSVSLTLPASAKAQASIGVEPQIQPIWAPYFTEDLPLVDFEFYLPNPATRAQIFTAASAFATAYFGVATTINQWPIWRPDKQNFVMSGKKVSMSASAEARVSVSVSESETSETIVTGNDINQDVSPSVRPMALPDCIHGAITPSGFSSMTASQLAGAGASIEGGENFPNAGAAAGVSGTADGFITPATLGATSPAAYPASGLYGKPNSQNYKSGYDRILVTTFDFSVLSGGTTPLPQITTFNFAATPMPQFVTGGAGLGFILPGSGILGFWVNTGTETQPDFSAYGVTAYVELDPATSGTSNASLTTNLGVANADLIYTAVTIGSAGNAITVAYNLTLTPSFTMTVSVSGNDIIVTPSTDAGTPQITTATAAGTVTASGNANIVITGSGISGSPVTIPVAVTNTDVPSAWAAKVITAINLNAAVTAIYTASGTGTSIVLTRNVGHSNDPTLNIAISTGTASGITAAPTSAPTQAGVAPAITSTAAQVKAAVLANGSATALVSVALTGGSDGSGVVIGMIQTHLSGGFSQPTPAGIASALQAVLASSYSGTWTATLPTGEMVQTVSTATGPQGFAQDVDSKATIQVIQPGQ